MINRIDIKGDVVDKISMDIFEAVERYEETDVVTVCFGNVFATSFNG